MSFFSPTPPKARAENALKEIEQELYTAQNEMEIARFRIMFLQARQERLLRYVANYDAVDKRVDFTGFSIPRAA